MKRLSDNCAYQTLVTDSTEHPTLFEFTSRVNEIIKEQINNALILYLQHLVANPLQYIQLEFDKLLEVGANNNMSIKSIGQLNTNYNIARTVGYVTLSTLSILRIKYPQQAVRNADIDCKFIISSVTGTIEDITPYVNTIEDENIKILITPSSITRCSELFNQHCKFKLKLETQRIETRSAPVPLWVYISLLILGFNELMYIITSPVLLAIFSIFIFTIGRRFISHRVDELRGSIPLVNYVANHCIDFTSSLYPTNKSR